MRQVVDIEVPSGYRVIERKKNIKVWDAEKILTTKKQRYYTKAVRNGVDVELVGSYLVCPFCGAEFASNIKYSCWQPEYERVSKDVIYKWSSLQLSFFEEKKKELYIGSEINKPASFKCPECNNVSNHSDEVKKVEMALEKNRVEIKSEITNISEVFALKWIGKDSVLITFPMYEILTFDFNKGRIYIKLENDKGVILCQRDVTPYPELLYGSVVHNLIMYNKKVNRNIKRMFKTIWGCELPYCGKGIETVNLFKMTMFVGYTKEFYSAIPYKLGSMEVDASFEKNVKKMRNAKNIVTFFEESALPKVKSVRRIFYRNPALFFYLDETEMVWEAIMDLNLFCKFIESDNIYEVLSDIHMRPGIMEYISDLCKMKKKHFFVKKVQYGWRGMLWAAIDYGCSNSYAKKAILENWEGVCSVGRIGRRKSLYSVPMRKPEERIADCNIDGYDFFWLRSSNEYEIAGKELNNCLSAWRIEDSPVVCVKKDEQYVAAIEILNGMIVQAKAYNNSFIEQDRDLNWAFEKWQKKYQIEWVSISDDDYDYDYDMLLPD